MRISNVEQELQPKVTGRYRFLSSGKTVALLVVLAIAVPLAAHHSFKAEYDLNKPFFMDGKITKVEWTNPHVYIFIDVTDKQDKVVNWAVELTPPHSIQQNGWNRDRFKPGIEVCVEGFQAKNGGAKFGSTAVQLKSTGEILKTPPGNWMPVGTSLDTIPSQPEAQIQYTGKTSCSNRG